MKEDILYKYLLKNGGIDILVFNNIEVRTKKITEDKEGQDIVDYFLNQLTRKTYDPNCICTKQPSLKNA